MKEFSEMQSPKEPKFFDEIDKLSFKDKISVIQNQIIPLMNIRRGRKSDEYMSDTETHEKLHRPPISGKQGEYFELFEELTRSGT